ncbi:MAG: hypothetical protein K0Q94_3076 [Paenibacillus sp.]|jgi:hypothetical protein|nr:hypothetical protein [Paenibacillus sp.]
MMIGIAIYGDQRMRCNLMHADLNNIDSCNSNVHS